jgi:hypothetical protein
LYVPQCITILPTYLIKKNVNVVDWVPA